MFIYINNGVSKPVIFVHCREKVVIPKNKNYIFLRGNGKARTGVIWNDGSSDNSESATFTVKADNFVAFGISFKVSYKMSVLIFRWHVYNSS